MTYKPIFYIIFAVLMLVINPHGGKAMEITSKDFKHNRSIPSFHTCDGKDISPHLTWSEAPEGTKSFALSCIDPDAPMGDFIHWFIYNIPATVTEIPQGGPLPAGAQEISNDFGQKAYGGPCPPSGTHRYFFVLYALKIGDLGTVSKKDFLQKVKENQLATAQIIGLYKREN
jgi:Raf kinase inhibitor-like YbhB/YbcL family protein